MARLTQSTRKVSQVFKVAPPKLDERDWLPRFTANINKQLSLISERFGRIPDIEGFDPTDYVQLADLRDELVRIDEEDEALLDTEGEDEGDIGGGQGRKHNRRTTRRRRFVWEVIGSAVEGMEPTAAPPNVAAASAIGTTTSANTGDLPRFALEDHTHGGVLGAPVGGGNAGEVAFFTSSFEIDGDPELTYNATTNVLSVPTVQGNNNLRLRSGSGTTPGATTGLLLDDNLTTIPVAGYVSTQFNPAALALSGSLFGFEVGDAINTWTLAANVSDIAGFGYFPRITNTAGVARTLSFLGTVDSLTRIIANGATLTVSLWAPYNTYGDLSVTGGGTLTMTAFSGLDQTPQVQSGATIGTYRGINIAPTLSGSGAITTFVGAEITAPAAGTAISLRSATSAAQMRHAGSAIFGANEAPVATLSVGSGSLFRVAGADGDLERIKNVAYDWPAANAAGRLTNDGSGNLSWSSAAVAGTIILQESDVDVNTAVQTLDFTESDGTLLTSAGSEVDVNMDLYFLRSGRPTGRNSYVLSSDTSTALLSGGTAGGQNVDFEATTSSTKGVIQFRDTIRLFSNPPSPLAATTAIVTIDNALTTVSGSSTTLRYHNYANTITLQDNIGTFNGMRLVPTFTNANATSFTLGSGIGFVYNPVYTPGGGTATMTGLTHRALQSNPTFTNAGTGNTVTSSYAVAASSTVDTNWTVTDWGGLIVNAPTGGGTITNLYGVNVAALASLTSTLVAAYHSEVAAGTGKFFLHDTGGAQSRFQGIITTYDNIATVERGIPYEVASINLTAQGAAIAATTLYAVPASQAGFYRISWVATVTRAATTSSTLGGANTGFRISYTNANDSVVKTSPLSAAPAAGTNQAYSQTNQLNTTGAQISGVIVVRAAASTNIQYTMGYTSAGATTMQYDLSVVVERL